MTAGKTSSIVTMLNTTRTAHYKRLHTIITINDENTNPMVAQNGISTLPPKCFLSDTLPLGGKQLKCKKCANDM